MSEIKFNFYWIYAGFAPEPRKFLTNKRLSKNFYNKKNRENSFVIFFANLQKQGVVKKNQSGFFSFASNSSSNSKYLSNASSSEPHFSKIMREAE